MLAMSLMKSHTKPHPDVTSTASAHCQVQTVRVGTALGQCGLPGNRGGCWGTLPSIFSQPTAQISRLFVWGWVPWETSSETLRFVCKRFIGHAPGINSGGKGRKQNQAEGGADLRYTLNEGLLTPQGTWKAWQVLYSLCCTEAGGPIFVL